MRHRLPWPAAIAGSVLLNAPVFPPNGRASKPGTRFDAPVRLPVSTPAAVFGFPINIGTKAVFESAWDKEQHCPRQREAGMVDVVWKAIAGSPSISCCRNHSAGILLNISYSCLGVPA